MTRDKFIKKWLGNPDYKYCEENRDTMRDDLDLVIEKVIKNHGVSHHVSGIRPTNPAPTNKVDVHAEALYKGGQMLMAVKHIYNNTSMSLKDAKKYVDTNYR